MLCSDAWKCLKPWCGNGSRCAQPRLVLLFRGVRKEPQSCTTRFILCAPAIFLVPRGKLPLPVISRSSHRRARLCVSPQTSRGGYRGAGRIRPALSHRTARPGTFAGCRAGRGAHGARRFAAAGMIACPGVAQIGRQSGKRKTRRRHCAAPRSCVRICPDRGQGWLTPLALRRDQAFSRCLRRLAIIRPPVAVSSSQAAAGSGMALMTPRFWEPGAVYSVITHCCGPE